MPQIVMGPNQTGKVDPSVKKAAYTFLEKLAENDAVPGLHIEPINGSVDRRVRTGRVNDFWRAVLFKIQGQADEAHYVYVGVLPHDDAITFAKKTRLKVNPVNGIAELVMATEPQQPAGYSPTLSAQNQAGKQVSETHAEIAADTPLAEAQPTNGQPAPAELLLAQHGVTLDDLLDLGVDKELAEAAVGMTTDDELLAHVERAPEWQALALIDLAGGKPLEDVRATLGIGKVELQGETETDDELLRALRHEASRLEFAFIESDEELRKAIEEDDFAAWRVFLHPEQRRYATASYKGPFRLSGGAGTGKTVVLLHRARHLTRQNPGASILLTTFNKVLAESLQIDLRRLDPTLRIAEKLGGSGNLRRGRRLSGQLGDPARG
ncbi:UvrD-helicase domain-containing protein [Georgenia sp. SUBG003]|uniref:UvrD-helicase domain-containing protein n=1 Tax=Georgenia sp. SUBG003 TaxID=1497974 RepID=UPI0006939B84